MKKVKKENWLFRCFDFISNGICNGIETLGKMASKKEGRSMLDIMAKILTILLLTWALEFPFFLAKCFARWMFGLFSTTITSLLEPVFDTFCTYSYLISAVAFIFYVIRHLIANDHSKEDLSKEVLKPVLKFLRAFLIVLTIPLLILLIILLLCFILLVVGIFLQVYSIGLFAMLLGAILMIFGLLWMIHYGKEERL